MLSILLALAAAPADAAPARWSLLQPDGTPVRARVRDTCWEEALRSGTVPTCEGAIPFRFAGRTERSLDPIAVLSRAAGGAGIEGVKQVRALDLGEIAVIEIRGTAPTATGTDVHAAWVAPSVDGWVSVLHWVVEIDAGGESSSFTAPSGLEVPCDATWREGGGCTLGLVPGTGGPWPEVIRTCTRTRTAGCTASLPEAERMAGVELEELESPHRKDLNEARTTRTEVIRLEMRQGTYVPVVE